MSLPPLAADEFDAVFQEMHGHSPFPWQGRLARLLTGTGRWPEALDLPTGSGKTAAIDAALFHLALEADRGPERRAAVRIAFVVDRRIIVDEAAERAKRIADALAGASGDGPVGRMATRLRHLSGDGPPLLVRSLRGGIPREHDWTRTPGQPTVFCSTIDQVGSRLLFRGYGVSNGMKPVHAGLLGSDCLFLLDEAHLAVPFAQTLKRIAAYRAPPWCEAVPGPWRFVTLSATPLDGIAAFRLEDDDRGHPVLARRLSAAKPAALRALKLNAKDHPDGHAQAFAEVAWELFESDAVRTLAVVVNRVALARRVFETLRTKAADSADVILLTGRTRGIDRDNLIEAYQERLKSGADAAGRPLLVVATQTIEAGADFDFDALVTQIAPLDALRQRFGRLNRMGRDIPAPAMILAAKDESGARADDPIYGDRAKKTWDWLMKMAGKPEKKGADPMVDFGIDAFAVRLSENADDVGSLATEKPDAPILRPADMMLLSWTAPIPAVDPAISLFLHGPKAGAADVQIVWRADLTEDTIDKAGDILALVPPHGTETLSVPLWAARAWLRSANQEAAETADVEGIPAGPSEGEKPVFRHAFRWAGSDAPANGGISANDLRPGDVIVVPAIYGGCDAFGWNPTSNEPVMDLGDRRPASRRWIRRLHPELDPDIWDQIGTAVSRDSDLTLAERIAALKSAGIGGEDCTLRWAEGYAGAVLVALRPNPSTLAAATEDDESGSLAGRRLELDRHGADVEAKAKAFALAAGLSSERAVDVTLAAQMHDLGKTDPRFQVWLRGGDRLMAAVESGEPLAKSPRLMSGRESQAARKAAGLPEQWRHEAQSVSRAIADPRFRTASDPELVLWLIGVHHGHGRPLFPHHDPRERPDNIGPQRLDFQFRGYDWPQMFERLKARYGSWELARMEAIVRLADHRASEDSAP